MNPKEYKFVTNWRVKSTVEEVYKVLSDPVDFVRWWPSVYLEVTVVKEGNKSGLGQVVKMRTKGQLPYNLYLEAEAVELNKPHSIKVTAIGDLEGHGEWKFTQDGEWVDIEYDWVVITRKAWMNSLSVFLEPIFEANHRWAMNEGEIALIAELERRG